MGQGGIPIRIRRTVDDNPPNDNYLGEPYLNVKDNKFGVYNGTDMLWYPGIDPINKRMVMNPQQQLTGVDSAGDQTIALDFDQPNALRIVHLPTNTQLAEFSPAGVSFSGTPVVTQLAGGTYDMLRHPGFIPSLFDRGTLSTTAGGMQWVGPNTKLWKTTGGVGDIQVELAPTESGAKDTTHMSADTYVLKATVTSGPTNGIGIRTCLFNFWNSIDATGNGALRFFITLKGDAGETMEVRAGRDGLYTTITVIGTGLWERIAVDIPDAVEQNSLTSVGDGIAFDFCRNPSGGTWYFAEPTCADVSETGGAETYQYRSLIQRHTDAAVVWETPAPYRAYDSDDFYVAYQHKPYAGTNTLTEAHVSVEVVSTVNPISLSQVNHKNNRTLVQPLAGATGAWFVELLIAQSGGNADIS